MCANNLDPQIATYVGTAKPQKFDALMSKESTVDRQLARQKSGQPKREERKRSIKKGELMVTFVRTSPKPTNGKNFNKNGKGKQKEEDWQLILQERKEKKYTFNDDDV